MSKDNQGAIFIKDFAAQLIREKVMMEKPDPDFYPMRQYGQAFQDAAKEYNAHVASRRTFPYDVKEEQDGKGIKGSEFRLQHQMTTEKRLLWYCCSESAYNNTKEGYRRIIAIPIEPDTPLQLVKDEQNLYDAVILRDKIVEFIETAGKKLLPSTKTEILAMIYESSPPEPSSGVDGEKEVMIQAFDKVRKLFESRSWIMEGRGSYPYNDDRYRQEVRYLYDEFDALQKDVWKNIKTKTFEYRNKIIADYVKSEPSSKEQEGDAIEFAKVYHNHVMETSQPPFKERLNIEQLYQLYKKKQ